MTTIFKYEPQDAVHGVVAAPAARPCSLRGCTHNNAQLCASRDRRGRQCTATFCPAHSVSFSGTSYCRRHAGTVQAIGELSKDPNGFPDLNARAPPFANV